MDTYADSLTSYRADLAYRREQLVTGVDTGRAARRRHRRPLLGLPRARQARTLTRADLARGA